MVRVIDPNTKPELRHKCRACLATLSFTEDDVKRRESHDCARRLDVEEWINCPSCGAKNILASW